MGLNLGLENLNENTKKETVISAEALITLTDDVSQSMHEAQALIEGHKNLLDVLDMLKEFGYVKGMEKLVDMNQINGLLGINVKTASTEQIAIAVSNEDILDTMSKLAAKISGAIGRVADVVANFVKTTLPFKEKYLKNIVNYKKIVSGREKDVDAEKFAATSVMGISKAQWSEIIEKRKTLIKTITDFSNITNAHEDLDKFLSAINSNSDITRVGPFMIAFAPWLTRVFVRGKVSSLGWTAKDVPGILNDAIAEAETLTKTTTVLHKTIANMRSINKKISLLRATGEKAEAVDLRKKFAVVNEFFLHIYSAVHMYEVLIRKELYFANSIGAAAVNAISK